MIANVVEKKEISDGVVRQALISGISGGFASGATQGVNMAIGKAVSHGASRVAIQTTSGAIVSGTTGAMGCVLNNILTMKKIEKIQMLKYLQSCGASEQEALRVWENLNKKGYIHKGEFTPVCIVGIELDDHLIRYEGYVNEIYELS